MDFAQSMQSENPLYAEMTTNVQTAFMPINQDYFYAQVASISGRVSTLHRTIHISTLQQQPQQHIKHLNQHRQHINAQGSRQGHFVAATYTNLSLNCTSEVVKAALSSQLLSAATRVRSVCFHRFQSHPSP
jgi:hypothetical protein